VTLPFDVWGRLRGTYHSDASLTSDKTKGTTIATRAITITPAASAVSKCAFALSSLTAGRFGRR
jgi:hypothetical protein